MTRFLIAAVVLAALVTPAIGQSSETDELTPRELADKLYTECGYEMSLPGLIAECVMEKEKAFGKELDQVYRKALTLAGTNKSLLRENQRNWLKFQKSNCKLEGRIALERVYKSSNEAGCLLTMTLEQLHELRKTVAQLEELRGTTSR